MPSESQSGSRIEEADCELYEGRAMTCPLLEALNIRQSIRILNKYPCLSLNFGPLNRPQITMEPGYSWVFVTLGESPLSPSLSFSD